MPIVKLDALPPELKLWREAALLKTRPLDRGVAFRPSALSYGNIKISALAGDGTLWYADPKTGALWRAGLCDGRAELVWDGKPVRALYLCGSEMWALCDDCACTWPAAAYIPVPAASGENPRQKLTSYYSVPPDDVAEHLKKVSPPDDRLCRAMGAVCSCPDGEGGRYVALENALLHFARKESFDEKFVETYAGGRFIYGNDPSVCGLYHCGRALWIKNALGCVRLERRRMTLEEKAEYYDRVAWTEQSVRGSLCDTIFEVKNGERVTRERYSTNNDALWSILHGMSEAFRYRLGLPDARERLVRITENVLLQSHVHGWGNGFTCRGYVSKKDRPFIKDGQLATGGLWYKKGERESVCVDTQLAHFGRDDSTGRNFLLTDEVKRRLGTDADRPVDGDFRLSVPVRAEVPDRLARLYREADPYHPQDYPASADTDIIFKTDTSSEEVIAAFVQYYFTWRHLILKSSDPSDAELGELMKRTAAMTLTHILDNGCCLRDGHGNPTQWGKWFADYFRPWGERPPENWPHPVYAFADGPLNSAEFMCILRVTMYLLRGDERYAGVFARAREMYELCFDGVFDGKTNGAGYAGLLKTYRDNLEKLSRLRGRGDYELSINYSDEQLAIIAFWPLIELEDDPGRLALLRAGLDEWWDNMKREGNPLYTFAYAALNPGKRVDSDPGDDALNRMPLPLVGYPIDNSGRNDLVMVEGGERPATNVLLPIDEQPLHKYNGTPFNAVRSGEPGGAMYEKGYMYTGNIFTLPYYAKLFYGL